MMMFEMGWLRIVSRKSKICDKWRKRKWQTAKRQWRWHWIADQVALNVIFTQAHTEQERRKNEKKEERNWKSQKNKYAICCDLHQSAYKLLMSVIFNCFEVFAFDLLVACNIQIWSTHSQSITTVCKIFTDSIWIWNHICSNHFRYSTVTKFVNFNYVGLKVGRKLFKKDDLIIFNAYMVHWL